MNDKKVIIVTGASRGIGKAVCTLFLEKGCTVYAFSRGGCDLIGVNSIICDITDGNSLKKSVELVYLKENRIDVLINNAGAGISGAVEKTTVQDAKKLFDINFFAQFETIKYVVPYMRSAKNGKIVNIGSVAGAMHVPFQAFYSAGKAALEALSNCLRGELYPFGIKVTTVMPGDTSTGFTDAREKKFDDNDPDYGERISRSIKMMEHDERNGMKPRGVAKVIYKAVSCKNPKPLYTVGFKYNFFIFLNKILPKRFVQFALNSMYAK
ncbi:MAG: SDR family oxidoreductase [Treponema sp.]|nr:SDR family oxidoreductase [Treponema sp.]